MLAHIVQQRVINLTYTRLELMTQPEQYSANTSRTSQQAGDMQADITELRKLLSERNEDLRKQRFRNVYDTIQELIAVGVSNAAIIKKLKDMGLSVAPVTFKNWLAEIQRERHSAAAGNQPGQEVSQVQEAMRRSATARVAA